MGTLVGHVAPGFGFFIIGLWHLINHIKLHVMRPNSYTAPSWFPTSRYRYLELYSIMAGSCASIAMELFIGPERHQPFDSDGTIPSNHLHNFEHSSISMTFLVYAVFAVVLDRLRPKAQHELTQLLGGIAFAQQLLLFHLHSADHMGPEGQYHLLLQLVVLVSLTTTLMSIGLANSFVVSFVRSLSIFFQGLWFMVMGFMLWTPELIPKGCYIHLEEGHHVVRCTGEKALHRAKSLVNLQFSWYLIGTAVFGVSLYLVTVKLYGENNNNKVEYFSLTRELEEQEGEDSDDVESQKTATTHGASLNYVHMSHGPKDIER
ncbi:hypothetical protein FEM48_Zijuj04G0007000 [Ziziphus jujuba var. spinosa]|uniref:Transmembrane protein 45A-like n=1 Tax=Ziziphus jujuba var. spinosa TaxID=714518 RepID=A0A978VGU7_ZIZJJ|nr:hypothetical protein FEM48_Zijuj04G0007000 [Ziziphus jujuba var. spinosa]